MHEFGSNKQKYEKSWGVFCNELEPAEPGAKSEA